MSYPSIDELVDPLGELVDKAENYMMYGQPDSPFAKLNSDIRVNALTHGLEEIRDKVKELYFSLGGEDVWPSV